MTADSTAPSSNGLTADSSRNGVAEGKKRVTFVLPPALDYLLEIYCSGAQKPKNQVVAQAIAEFLTRNRKDFQKTLNDSHTAIQQLLPSTESPRRRRAGA